MINSEERGHATVQVDRLLTRCFPNQPMLKLVSLRNCAIEKATQAIRMNERMELDAELAAELQQALELLPAGVVRQAAARTFSTKYKAIPANYAAYNHVVTHPNAVARPKKSVSYRSR